MTPDTRATDRAAIELLVEPVLCYVKGSWAYFTTCPLEHQWGDDWNDAPYEHNAGTPYHWSPYNLEKYGIPQYEIITVGWLGDFETPDEWVTNSRYSVEMINRGDVAWLAPGRYGTPKDAKPIYGGCTLSEFRRLIWLNGGEVYEQTHKVAHARTGDGGR